MIHKTKRILQKIGISFIRMVHLHDAPKKREPDFNSEGARIFRNLLRRDDSTLLLSPIAGKRYIKSDKLDIFIKLYDKKMSIINHQFKYDIDLTHTTTYRLENMFDLQVEKRRNQMEEEITSNVKSSLSHIYGDLLKM